jgi:hypothetical protein
VPVSTTAWRHTRQRFVAEVDTLITVGGGDGTYQVGLELSLTRKKLVPIGSFGGASSRLLKERLLPGTLKKSESYQKLANPWIPGMGMENHVIEVVGANLPPRVLIIHGHAPDRLELQEWLQDEQLADGVVLGEQDNAGQTLPEKFERDASEADAAIALATPDDVCSLASQPQEKRYRARQNVWVEVGWFWGRLGRNRVLTLARGDIEIPSDVNPILYEKYTKSPTEAAPKIRTFLADIGRTSQ